MFKKIGKKILGPRKVSSEIDFFFSNFEVFEKVTIFGKFSKLRVFVEGVTLFGKIGSGREGSQTKAEIKCI